MPFGIDDAVFWPAAATFAGGVLRNSSASQVANNQMDFQYNMASTQYQRGVKDLEAAGLNPMLAYMNGGASSASGAMPNVEDVVSPAVHQGFSAAQQKAQTDLIKAQTSKTETDAALSAAQIEKVKADTITSGASAGSLNQGVVESQARVNKINAELANIPLQGKQIEAITREVLSRVPLNAAMTGRVTAETEKVIAETTNVRLTSEQIKQMTEKIAAEAQLMALRYSLGVMQDWPQAEAMGKFWRSPWGKNISPYLPDILKGTHSAGSLSRLF